MQDQLTSHPEARPYGPLLDRFSMLGIDPAATNAQVAQAFALASEQAVASNQLLTEARDSMLDPARRLMCELGYPLDSTPEQVKAFYKGLSANAPMSQLLANTLPPLSKANYLACLAARKPADAASELPSARASIARRISVTLPLTMKKLLVSA